MKIELHHAHPWDLSPREAAALQAEMAGLVVENGSAVGFRTDVSTGVPRGVRAGLRTVAGVDVSVRGDSVRTAVVVLDLATLEPVDAVTWDGPVAWPYVPGLLSFREVPAILPALERLSAWPDAFVCDGQGRAHPRRFGLACHLGVLLDAPCVGCAKTRLTGTPVEPGPSRGEQAPLVDAGEEVGRVVRTRSGVSPVYVSVGHRMGLDEAAALVLACAPRYRIPEPTRLAHLLSYHGSLPVRSRSARGR